MAVFALAATPAVAQGSAVAKEREAPALNEVERGVYLALGSGAFFLVNPPAAPGAVSPFSAGQSLYVEAGYDLGERVSIGIFGLGTVNRGGPEYRGVKTDASGAQVSTTYAGDFFSLAPGLNVRVNLVGFEDAQSVKRFWLYLRAGAGFQIFSPRTLLPGFNVIAFGGPGLEYFTRLRHFSIGIDATFTFLALTQTFGFAVTPSLRYAF